MVKMIGIKLIITIVTVLFIIKPTDCFFHWIKNDTFVQSASKGFLNKTQFSFKSLDNSRTSKNSTLPTSIQVQATVNGTFLDVTLNQVQGILNNAYLNNKVYQIIGSQVQQMKGSDLQYQIYRDQKNKAFATVVSNSDLNEMGINTNGSNYRIMMSTVFNGAQLDLYPSIKTDSAGKQLSYQQMFILRTPSASDDQSDIKSDSDDNKNIGSNYSWSDEEDDGNDRFLDNKGLLNKENMILKENQFRSKRAITVNGTARALNLYVEYLMVIDSTVYKNFLTLYGNLSTSLITQYLNIFFVQLANGINQRYQNSLKTDPDLMLTISATNLLVFPNVSSTPWTNTTLNGVPGIPIYNGRSTILCNASFASFSKYMTNLTLPFTYDHAVAVMDKDIWSNTAGTYVTRSAVIGYSSISGICTTNKYSLVEFIGFNNIQNAGHELGHNLGAVHDATGVAINCSASSNYMMTAVVGAYSNSQNLYSFSNCSINSFKSTLLNSNKTNVTSKGSCLLNPPVAPLMTYFNSSYLPGQLYTLDQQCQFLLGPLSSYSACYIDNDPICDTLYCYDPSSGSCLATVGYGALDGTPCPLGSNSTVCYRSNCVSSSTVVTKSLSLTSCSPNPCLNGGTCVNGFTTNFFVCNCASGYTGSTCQSTVVG